VIMGFIHRYLDPVDSLGELLFGLIMALTVTLGARVLAQRSEINPQELIVAMIGCNVAWGIIDAALYLIGSVFSRNQRIRLVQKLRAATGESEAMEAIRDAFSLEDEPPLSEQDRATFHRVILDLLRHADTRRAHLRWLDLKAAAAIVVLVSLTAVPGVLPFVLLDDSYVALRFANLLQIVLLFLVGFRWARYTGAAPWRTGLLIVALGVGLVAISVALGG
jgi:VIT1/CCC1 family predicted Fe2+/Mn2+ transporter